MYLAPIGHRDWRAIHFAPANRPEPPVAVLLASAEPTPRPFIVVARNLLVTTNLGAQGRSRRH